MRFGSRAREVTTQRKLQVCFAVASLNSVPFSFFFFSRQLLFDDQGNLKRLGENITNPQYAKTLEDVRDYPESFYNGPLASRIVRDISMRGGIMTLKDLKDYKVIRKKALVNELRNMTWYTVPPPASGPVITLILNILKGMFQF